MIISNPQYSLMSTLMLFRISQFLFYICQYC
nr:MAG TPA: hypothetical protein [Caudoviricetes sp.]